jgi:cell division protease FtsH
MDNLTSITQKLEKIKILLKEEFIGLDEIIDQFVQAVNPWCNMAQTQDRPLIVNLWGMTGVGKTSLVKRFLELWDKDEDVIHLNMGSKNYTRDVLDSMERMFALEAKPAVLIFDEFQHAKTIDMMGMEIDNPVDRMIWQLMDSGKFSIAGFRRYKPYFQEILVSMEICLDKGVVIEKGKVIEGWDIYCDIMEIDDDIFRKAGKPDTFALSKHQFSDLYDLAIRDFPFRSQFKEHLLQMNGREMIEYIKNLEKKSMLSKELDFSKFLVIVIGNLDEAYEMSNIISMDKDPDLMYEASKRINFSMIKDALSLRFRMEEISRLGNIHIIYPSLNSKVYKTFIQKELENIAKRFEDSFGCRLTFGKQIKNILFEEGVVASQGFRPLRSSIRYLIDANVLELLQRNPVIRDQDYLVDMIDDKMLIKVGDQVLCDKKLHLPVREAKNQRFNPELSAIIAVHEAGHAIVHMLLKHTLPQVVSIASTDQGKGGYMSVKKSLEFLNKEHLVREIAVRLAGKMAEELVFGKENITEGAENDVWSSTSLLLDTYRSGCISPNTATYESVTRGSGQLLPEDHISREWVEKYLNKSYKLAGDTLEAHKDAFSALVELLLKKRTLNSEDIQSGLAAYGIHCGQLLSAYPRPFHYRNKLEVFLNGKAKALMVKD